MNISHLQNSFSIALVTIFQKSLKHSNLPPLFGLFGLFSSESLITLQTLPGLTDQQKGVCTKVPETVESVPFGTRQGLVECEYQFRNELWNCSDNRDSRRIQQTIDRGEMIETSLI